MLELKIFSVPAAGKSWGEAQDEEEARQQQEDDAEEAVDHEGDGGHREGVLHLVLRHNQMSQCAQILCGKNNLALERKLSTEKPFIYPIKRLL